MCPADCHSFFLYFGPVFLSFINSFFLPCVVFFWPHRFQSFRLNSRHQSSVLREKRMSALDEFLLCSWKEGIACSAQHPRRLRTEMSFFFKKCKRIISTLGQLVVTSPWRSRKGQENVWRLGREKHSIYSLELFRSKPRNKKKLHPFTHPKNCDVRYYHSQKKDKYKQKINQ